MTTSETQERMREMSEELKPCPFCGEHSHYGWGTHRADCYFSYKSDNTTNYRLLTMSWQYRPIEDALRKQLDELKSKHDFILHECKDMETRLDIAMEALSDYANSKYGKLAKIALAEINRLSDASETK